MQFLLYISHAVIPLTIFTFILYGILSHRPVFHDFLEGAKHGLETTVQLVPTLVGLIVAVGMLRASGFLDFVSELLAVPASIFHIPAAVVPVGITRLFSNSAAVGLMLDLFQKYGVDSREGLLAAVMMSSTETLVYCISIYYGHIGVTKLRWTIVGALAATFAGMVASVWISSVM